MVPAGREEGLGDGAPAGASGSQPSPVLHLEVISRKCILFTVVIKVLIRATWFSVPVVYF